MTPSPTAQSGYASTSGVPVVFLSGMLADQRMWHPAIAAYAALDGHNKPAITPIFCELFDFETVGEMAHAVLVRAPDRFVLVGMSMGGYAAFEIMRRAPERVSHLMLVNTRATEDSPSVRRRRLLLSRIAAKEPFVGINDGMLDDMLHPDQRHDAGLVTLLADMGRDCGARVFARQNTAVANRPDSMRDLPGIAAPCSVVVGSHDRVISPESHREMADAIPGATYTEIPGAAHYTPLEQPKAFAQCLSDLLIRQQLGRNGLQ
jgi:pimeloyl-ACP methyl ester carboxylesterase